MREQGQKSGSRTPTTRSMDGRRGIRAELEALKCDGRRRLPKVEQAITIEEAQRIIRENSVG